MKTTVSRKKSLSMVHQIHCNLTVTIITWTLITKKINAQSCINSVVSFIKIYLLIQALFPY
jgi:hypothetical protein